MPPSLSPAPPPLSRAATAYPSFKKKLALLRRRSAPRSGRPPPTSPTKPMASSKEAYRVELRAAARQLGERGLYSAAKWAAELLVGIDPDATPAPSSAMDTPSSSGSGGHLLHLHRSGGSSFRRRLRPGAARRRLVPRPSPTTTTRSMSGLIGTCSPRPNSTAASTAAPRTSCAARPAARPCSFAAMPCTRLETLYSNIEMNGQYKVLTYSSNTIALMQQGGLRIQAGEKWKEEETVELEGSLGKSNAVNQELVALERELATHRRTGAIDSFCLYLYGIVLRDKGSEALARTVLVESVNSYPWNWSAWLELQSLCTSSDILNNLNLKNHWMKDFFLASAHLELKMHEEALKRYERLMGVFRCSDYIQAQIATVQYSMRDLDEADMIFEELLRTDPFRVDSMDVYSNLLRAVDINPRDYRAWYGLGQIYEMMGMPFYAVYYFRKSSYLQPNDAQLWNAMAQCYESDQLQMIEEAIKCYERSANNNDTEGIALHQLAKLHGMLGQSEEAAFYYKKDLERMEVEERQGQNFVEALLFLAKHCKSIGRFEEAEHYCTRLLDYTGPERETAKSILQGLKRSQSVLPLMDIDHFAMRTCRYF
uniref:Cdc23 domain-containing protein n=1 Tax=Oryza nivara TaxID=4536 RepID=A0A0E0HUK3_ORYNI